MAMRVIKPGVRTVLMLAALLIPACASVQIISERDVDDKLAKIKLGQTTMAEVGALFGAQHGKDQQLWVYNLTDTAVEIAVPKSPVLPGIIPMVPMAAPTNTKALIAVRFSEAGTVKGLDVSRYFGMPYKTEYSHLVKGSAEKTLESVARIGEASGFKIAGSDEAAGTLDLEDIGSKARIKVKLEKQTLNINSINPHDRLSNEYRLFNRRASAFTDKISASEFIQ